MRKVIPLLLLSMVLLGCNSNSGGSTPSNPTPGSAFKPKPVQLEHLRLLDVTGQPLANVTFSIESDETEPASKALPDTVFSTDNSGLVTIPFLSAGNYKIAITIGDSDSALTMKVGHNNTNPVASVAMPVLLGEDSTLTSVAGQGFFASFNGIIHDDEGPVEGAQIELSAGAASNGAIATAISDENGHYSLVVNVGLAVVPSLSSVIWRVAHDDFSPLVINNLDIFGAGAVTGFNHGLVKGGASAAILYQETFGQTTAGAACGAWTSDAVDGQPPNLWHSHAQGLGLRNQALDDNLVKLAPDDQSQGAIPNPSTTRACWYGQPGLDPAEGQGNFLGTAELSNGGDPLDGGTSDEPNAGAIVSPLIDLTSATGPLSITFRNWWEIESVNPNNEGFDLMSVQVSTSNSGSWTTVARLNPLSDPVGLADRAPLPFSNRGYNKAPTWLWQEPIDISEFAGEQIRLRFEFDTVDELYNGFRGWLIDDVRIVNQTGTFPRWTGGEDDGNDDNGELQVNNVSPNAGMPLELGENYTFSVSAEYLGEAGNVQLRMSYISLDGMMSAQEPTLLAELEPGIHSGTLTSEPTTAEDTVFFILIEAVDDQGTELASEVIYYNAI